MRLALPVLALSLLTTRAALAADCPPGSVARAQDGYSFCEPTVCQTEAQCGPDEVCRPVALCMQVGTLDVDAATLGGAAAKRLVVTQACAPDKSCPQTTTCSDMGRCLAKATAARLGILEPKTATPEPAKKSCGCGVVGAEHGSSGFLAVLAGLAVATTRAARGRRARSRRAR